MKKIITLMVCVMLSLGLSACSNGSVKNVKTYEVTSSVYTEDDINSAIDVIKQEFLDNWKGCTLNEIYYAGDDKLDYHQDWADRNGADEVIVLLSSFDVAASGADGSLNPNSTYDDWSWILVRKAGGQWEHVDHGY